MDVFSKEMGIRLSFVKTSEFWGGGMPLCINPYVSRIANLWNLPYNNDKILLTNTEKKGLGFLTLQALSS
jgi:hypothetical protein